MLHRMNGRALVHVRQPTAPRDRHKAAYADLPIPALDDNSDATTLCLPAPAMPVRAPRARYVSATASPAWP